MIQSIKGLEQARIIRPGYAIEYDYVDPRELLPSLEPAPGRPLPGRPDQRHSGYEEAAAQGLIAGIMPCARCARSPPWSSTAPRPTPACLIDDLVTLGTKEPYRLFTSRAEYRLLLREDKRRPQAQRDRPRPRPGG